MRSGAMMYMKFHSGIQPLLRGIHRQHGDLIKLLFIFFFQNTESKLKMNHWNLHVLVPPCSSAIQCAYLHADHNEVTEFTDESQLSPSVVQEVPLTA
jgi:hypothetical protein